MLIVFHSKAASDVLMFSAHALKVMQAAGREYTDTLPERGVITHTQLPDFIAALEKAISLEKTEQAEQEPVEEDEDEKPHPISEPVSFRQRAWPLLQMLRASRDKKYDVMWEPAPKW